MGKKVCDHISQGWFIEIAFTVITKSGVLHKNHIKNMKNEIEKSRALCHANAKPLTNNIQIKNLNFHGIHILTTVMMDALLTQFLTPTWKLKAETLPYGVFFF